MPPGTSRVTQGWPPENGQPGNQTASGALRALAPRSTRAHPIDLGSNRAFGRVDGPALLYLPALELDSGLRRALAKARAYVS